MDILSALQQKKPALIMSLPGNDPRLAKAAKEAGADIFSIKNIRQTEKWLKESFENHRLLLKQIFGGSVPDFQAKLRWNRLFEAEILTHSSRRFYKKN